MSSAGQDHQPPRDEPRVLAGLDHAREVVQRRVDVAAPDALDERAGDVVVLVAVAVVADGGPVDRASRRRSASTSRRAVRDSAAVRPRPPARSAPSGRRRRRAGRAAPSASSSTSSRSPARPARVGDGAFEQRAYVVLVERRAASAARCATAAAPTTQKLGFSVVAATRVTQPFSTAGSSASCWVLEKRCTSSTNSTVSRPPTPSSRRASSMTARTSLTPAVTADSSTNARLGRPARPGGPASSCRCPAAPRGSATPSAAGAVALDQPAQRRARAEQVVLPDDLVERARPHPDGQRAPGSRRPRRRPP